MLEIFAYPRNNRKCYRPELVLKIVYYNIRKLVVNSSLIAFAFCKASKLACTITYVRNFTSLLFNPAISNIAKSNFFIYTTLENLKIIQGLSRRNEIEQRCPYDTSIHDLSRILETNI